MAQQLHLREETAPTDPNNYPGSKQLVVLKVGTSTLIDEDVTGFSLSNIGKLVDCIVKLRSLDYQVVLITSGGVGAGCLRLKMSKKPTTHVGKQAAAAVGQSHLMRVYDDLFAIRETTAAQLLITRTDLCRKHSFMNFKNTLLELLKMNVIPIINENDAVASDALKFGDNDTLAAYVALALRAQWLILLTDVDFLYTANPRRDQSAKPIIYCGGLDDVYRIVADPQENGGSTWGSGGIRTKVMASKVATVAGITTALCHGKYPERILDILEYCADKACDDLSEAFAGFGRYGGDPSSGVVLAEGNDLPYIGTVVAAQQPLQTVPDQRRWIIVLPVRGKVFVDEGAVNAVVAHNSSLFASGIVSIEGEFHQGEVVSLYAAESLRAVSPAPCRERSGTDSHDTPEAESLELARCLVNFASEDLERIKGARSDKFSEILGNSAPPEVAHRSNIVLLKNLDENH